ncbi:glycosyltransferase family 2 protein [Pseudomonas sp. CGJS7]|uniref:glycosyltransferase family 2 protein n=1 Tax=Pseudomonas sp. CGJS7 TaxID=3109348 RepID=UPI003007F3EF
MASTLSILVPVYNNAAFLQELYARTAAALTESAIDFELILVNDGSRDRSWEIIRELAAADTRVKALCLSRNFGQHAAISAALEHASGDRFVLMDADLQDRPELIPQLLAELAKPGHDIVYTLKEGGEEGMFRRMTSRAFHSFVGNSTGSHAAANIGTFRAFNRSVASALLNYRERAVVYGPLMHTMGYRTAFVPVPRDARIGSSSSYTFAKRLALALQSIVSYSTLPQKLLLWTGSSICLLSIAYLVAIIVQYLLGYDGLPQGLTLLVVLVLFLIGMVMVGLGVLAAYMFLIYREILDRPRYHVQQAINLDSP